VNSAGLSETGIVAAFIAESAWQSPSGRLIRAGDQQVVDRPGQRFEEPL